ncbi:hypothetical protein NPA08_00590 [Mycoplasmopsis citelli]|uniref:hypothetical protein n=1 Tax=Mycoplasmopsis citelli TaxID=171281 RepID=UPI00211564BE|nr:hypothetical protein [Mycoplasmopsis citelli]UUD36323.1 hypothetical protein NPA08_00590 [Mycoplasmopsis citelli]
MNKKETFDTRKYLNKKIREMFKDLKLIESFGTGIRRAKNALRENKSPKVEFYPITNSENDNYTEAIIRINKEFLKNSKNHVIINDELINKEEKKKEIISLLKSNPKLTAEQISNKLQINAIWHYLNELKKENKIKRVGSTKGREWIVIE